MRVPAGSNAQGADAAAMVVMELGKEMQAFDALPQQVRRWLTDAPVKFSAIDVHQKLAFSLMIGDVAGTIRTLRQAESNERNGFSDAHRRRYGRDLPHVAAECTALRDLRPDAWARIRA